MPGKDTKIPKVNCVILGDKGTGKSAFLNRHLNGEFKTENIGCQNNELIRFVVWDINGKEIENTIKPQCAIVLFDVTSSLTYVRAIQWKWCLLRSRQPISLCGNMIDLEHRIVPMPTNRNGCFDISVKQNINLEKPFLWLARALSGDPQLKFVPQPAPQPPEEKELCASAKQQRMLQIQQAMEIALPETI